MKRIVVLVTMLGALVLIGSSPAFVGKTDPTAKVSKNGHLIRATGPVTCDVGERLSLRVTITQLETAAYAEGRTRARCTGAELQWQVRALSRLRTRFAQGTAQACALGITRRNGHPTDAHQWCVDVTLVPAS
jgi:hypothetical protein